MKIEIRQRIDWLLAHNLPPLPVAPVQDSRAFPKIVKGNSCPLDKNLNPIPLYTGKNPSFLGDKIELVNHGNYQEKLPSQYLLKKWFANPENGIGTLGGIPYKGGVIVWIDLDRKCFSGDQEFELAVEYIDARLGVNLVNCLQEKTHSGGRRWGIAVKEAPDFTNFCLEPGGFHAGELLGKGRFTVLAPTLGPSGNSYESLHIPQELGVIERIDFLYPVSATATAEKPKREKKERQPISSGSLAIALENCLSRQAQAVLRGDDPKGDESYSLSNFVKEAYGWENWLNDQRIPFTGSPESLVLEAAASLGHDEDKAARVIKSCKDLSQYQPSCWFSGGDESCWKVIKRLNKQVYAQHYIQVPNPSQAKASMKDGAAQVEVKTSTPLREVKEWDDSDEEDEAQGQEGKGKSYSDPALSWKEKAFLDCFSDGAYISFGDDKKLALYKFNGQYYEKFPRAIAEARIIEWAYQNPVKSKNGKWVASHLSPDRINQIWEWTLKRRRVNDDLINPPGINLANGRLIIEWQDGKPNPSIQEHSEKLFYTYCSPIKFDPEADPTDCDRLLSCISETEQTIFLRSVALALDLGNFRRYTDRPRALFLEGVGQNGKDSLRLVTEQIFGHFMVDTSLTNFYLFEQGQIGGLADLEGALVSWASENSDQYKVEKLKSLFRLISGEQVKINPKGKDERTIKPNVVFFFNVNEAPRMDGSLNAMKSRFCVIRFQKTFKRNPNPQDSTEMKADPRFKYDPEWVQESVTPAFLNRVLAEIPKLAKEGIPYESLDHYFGEIRKKSNHLWEFVEEVGISEVEGGKIYISDLWAMLQDWYAANGTLEIIPPETDRGRPKSIWHEQHRRFDRPCKGANQVFDAFNQLFPKITKQRETADQSRLGQFYIAGIQKYEPTYTWREKNGQVLTPEKWVSVGNKPLKLVEEAPFGEGWACMDEQGQLLTIKSTDITHVLEEVN